MSRVVDNPTRDKVRAQTPYSESFRTRWFITSVTGLNVFDFAEHPC